MQWLHGQSNLPKAVYGRRSHLPCLLCSLSGSCLASAFVLPSTLCAVPLDHALQQGAGTWEMRPITKSNSFAMGICSAVSMGSRVAIAAVSSTDSTDSIDSIRGMGFTVGTEFVASMQFIGETDSTVELDWAKSGGTVFVEVGIGVVLATWWTCG